MPRGWAAVAVLAVAVLSCSDGDQGAPAPTGTVGATTTAPTVDRPPPLVCGDPDPPSRTEFEWLAGDALEAEDPFALTREAVLALLAAGTLQEDPGPLRPLATEGDLSWWGAGRFRLQLRQEGDRYVTVRTESCVGA